MKMIEKYEEDYEKVYLHEETIAKRCKFKYYVVFLNSKHFFTYCNSIEFLLFWLSYENSN